MLLEQPTYCIYIALLWVGTTGRLADGLSKATSNKYICQKKEKQEYIAVSSLQ